MRGSCLMTTDGNDLVANIRSIKTIWWQYHPDASVFTPPSHNPGVHAALRVLPLNGQVPSQASPRLREAEHLNPALAL